MKKTNLEQAETCQASVVPVTVEKFEIHRRVAQALTGLHEVRSKVDTNKSVAQKRSPSVRPRTDLQAEMQREGYLRLWQVLEYIPISKSAWWAGIQKGRFPPGVKLGPRTRAWSVAEILALCDSFGTSPEYPQTNRIVRGRNG
jgi:prophage regulatory protein